ncbi:hypothetical protein Fmac_011705 [Flemingia macrophylla]|uniref:Uncharacterized protein n=1 Tax=Flemingia macrophylla TaxID=520843 RepID=A0ABD1MN74_9FABA
MLKLAVILDEARSSYATHNRKLKELSLLRSKSTSPSHFFSAFSKTLTPLFDFHRRLASADRIVSFVSNFAAAADDEFLDHFLKFLLAAAAASNKTARYRACQIVSEHFCMFMFRIYFSCTLIESFRLPSSVTMIRSNSLHNEILSKLKLGREEFTQKLLNRRWTLPSPETKIHQLIHTQGPTFLLNTHPSFHVDSNKQSKHFYIVRDDLLHPLVNGNKARKLDALLPLLHHCSVTDVGLFLGYLWRLSECSHGYYCGSVCRERNCVTSASTRRATEILTGYNLMSTMYGNVTYVPRTVYANREEMLKSYANSVTGNNGSILCEGSHLRKILVVNEGAGDSVALLVPQDSKHRSISYLKLSFSSL